MFLLTPEWKAQAAKVGNSIPVQYDEEKKLLQGDVTRLRAQNAGLQSELESEKSENKSLKSELRELQLLNLRLSESVVGLSIQLDALS